MERKELVRQTGKVSLSTILCRFAGLVREVITASFFGTTLVYDAFLLAFMIPNFFRGLLAEGALSTAFIPVFTDYWHKKREKAQEVVSNSVGISLFSTISLSLLIFLGTTLFLFFHFSPKLYLTFSLLRITIFYLVFISLSALCMGILNSLGQFALPALSPLMLDAFWLLSLFSIVPFLGRTLEEKIFGLAIGVILGGLFQFLVQVPAVKKKGISLVPRLNLKHPAVQKMGFLLAPSLIGVAVTPINLLVDYLLATSLGAGMVSSLWYATRLMQLPLGVFGIAIATVSLPSMAFSASKGNIKELKETLSFSLTHIFFFLIPTSIGLILLRKPLISLLFERGLFSATSTQLTSFALLFYSLGLFAYGSSIVVVRAFYSLQDTRTPVKVGLFSIGINLIFDIILMRFLKQGGIALSTSVVGITNFLILLYLLRKKLGNLDGKNLSFSFIKILLISIIMGLFIYLCYNKIMGIGKIGELFIPLTIGLVSYILLSLLFNRKQIKLFWK